MIQFARGFLRKISNSNICQAISKVILTALHAIFVCGPLWWHWYSSDSHQIDHANVRDIDWFWKWWQTKDNMAWFNTTESEQKALIGFYIFSGNEYLLKASIQFHRTWRFLWYISDNLRVGMKILFVVSTHQTDQVLIIQDFRSFTKSNCHQSKSLVFSFYSLP